MFRFFSGSGWAVRCCQIYTPPPHPLGSSRRLGHQVWIKSTGLPQGPCALDLPLPSTGSSSDPGCSLTLQVLGGKPSFFWEDMSGRPCAKVFPNPRTTCPPRPGGHPPTSPEMCSGSHRRWCGMVAKHTGSEVLMCHALLCYPTARRLSFLVYIMGDK